MTIDRRFPASITASISFCIISLCADIEAFFKALFQGLGYPTKKGKGFFQRFDEVTSVLKGQSFDFSSIQGELKLLRLAFSVRHISIHNLGLVDQDFLSATKLCLREGDIYFLSQEDYRQMFDAYAALLRNIDETLSSKSAL